jgi:hypothetical protein
MTQRQLHHFFDLSKLLAATTDVIIADSIESFFLFLRRIIAKFCLCQFWEQRTLRTKTRINFVTYFSLDWISFAVDNSVGSDDAVGLWLSSDNFELDSSHA